MEKTSIYGEDLKELEIMSVRESEYGTVFTVSPGNSREIFIRQWTAD